MGVNLKPLIRNSTLNIDDLIDKVISVDASNVLHQFLSTIRNPDGTPLTDSRGNVTSHLVGLFYRTIRLLKEFSIKPVYVFDGEMPMLKRDVIEKRERKRRVAEESWVHAIEEGDKDKAHREAVRSTHLNKQMLGDAEKLLDLLGLPTIQAPGEAESQCAFMTHDKNVYAMNSRDYDSLLFGAEKLLRHLTISNRENIEIIVLKRFLEEHEITLEQLVDIGILMGTDYNNGIYGVGPKTSLKLIKAHGRIEDIPEKYLTNSNLTLRKLENFFLSLQ